VTLSDVLVSDMDTPFAISPPEPDWVLEHDPEKRVAVFRKDHAPTKT
jgi:hypothetical protein